MSSKSVQYFFTILLLAMLVAGGCRPDVDELRPYPASLTELQLLLKEVPNQATQTTFVLNNLHRDTMLTTSGGVRVFLNDTEELFANESGQVVPCSSCTSLTVATTEALRKGDFVAQGIPTYDTNGNLVESGGAVRLTVICDGKKLQLLPSRTLKVQIPSPTLLDNMFIFNGLFPNNEFAGWQATTEPAYWANWPGPVPSGPTVDGYEIYTNALDWVGCQRVIDPTPNSFCVDLPEGFDDQNTQCYLVFKNMRSIVPLLPTPGSKQFCFKNAPPGLLVRILTVSKTGNSYWLGSLETEVGTDAVVPLVPEPSSEQEILAILKAL